MQLKRVQITNFQSVQDSTEFDIGDVTCLVGKNEAGKTALLKALYRLNPIISGDGTFDVTEDYPRHEMSEYEGEVSSGRRKHANVIAATYELEPEDLADVEKRFGKECLTGAPPTLTLTKGYENKRTFVLDTDGDATLKHLVESADLSQTVLEQIRSLSTVEETLQALKDAEQTDAVRELTSLYEEISQKGISSVVYNSVLRERIPVFLYFDEYYQLTGQANVDELQGRIRDNRLMPPDRPLLGLIDLAGLSLEQLTDPGRTSALLSRLQAAENRLTQTVLKYWSQNRHLRLGFDIRPAQSGDPAGMTSGMNLWGLVTDTKHMVSTGLGTRSRGFVWFFSFLAWYSTIRKQNQTLILLLDEPGLSLHARAQADLLRYFETELQPHHQLIYTTHSPFMVDPERFDRVRIVQDLSIEADSESLTEDEQGTKVITEVLDATPDSLFPLQGALGYDIYQNLFIGPNSLVVEGVSDLLYIQTMSALLQERGKAGLSPDWTLTPVGGSDKVPTFVALIGAQRKLNVAVLVDFQKKDQQAIDNLYKLKLLSQTHVITYADFTAGNEADIEDMFEPGFYLRLVDGEYGTAIKFKDLPRGGPRILPRIEQYEKKHPFPNYAKFNHYRPARYLCDNLSDLASELTDTELERFQNAFDRLNQLL